ncbi:hypothetical protein CSUI_006694, partial [Cystoisospora suis]
NEIRRRVDERAIECMCLRHFVTGRRAHFAWYWLKQYTFVGIVSTHPPVCFFCLRCDFSRPCCRAET